MAALQHAGRIFRGGPARRAWFAAALALVAALAAILALLGPSVMIMAPWDAFLLLDGGWRILLGQTPHTDFYNPIGPLTYYFVSLGLRVAGPSLAGLSAGNILFLLSIGTWAAIAAFRRLHAPYAFLFVAFIAILLAATRSLGWDPQTNSYAMIYNRYGWALLSILYLHLFVPVCAAVRPAPAADAASAGALLGLLFLCKITYFIVGCGAFALAFALRPEIRRGLVPALLGACAACAAAWLAVGFNPLDYVRDVAAAAKSQTSGYRVSMARESVKANVANAAAFTALWLALVALPLARRDGSLRGLVGITVIVGYMMVSAFLITSGNANERSDLPMFFVAGLLLLDRARSGAIPAAARPEAPGGWLHAGAIVVVLAFAGGIASRDLASIAHSTTWREYRLAGAPPSQRFESGRLADFAIPHTTDWKTTFWRSRDLPSIVNEGLRLLRANAGAQESLAVMGFGDPFSFALGWPPPKNVPLWWDFEVSYDRKTHPPAPELFRNVSLVMIPVLRETDAGCCHAIVSSLQEIYGGHLAARFREVARSPHWILLKKSP